MHFNSKSAESNVWKTYGDIELAKIGGKKVVGGVGNDLGGIIFSSSHFVDMYSPGSDVNFVVASH